MAKDQYLLAGLGKISCRGETAVAGAHHDNIVSFGFLHMFHSLLIIRGITPNHIIAVFY